MAVPILTRIALTGDQIDKLEADQPAGCLAIAFGAVVHGNFRQPRPANLVLGWVTPEEAQDALEASGVAATAELEKGRLMKLKKKITKK